MGAQTQAIAAQFDGMRAEMGLGEDLLIQHAARSDYTTTTKITGGWWPESYRLSQDQEQTFRLRIAEHSGWDTQVMKTVSAVVFSGLRFQLVKTPRKPFGEPLVWLLTVDQTGELV